VADSGEERRHKRVKEVREEPSKLETQAIELGASDGGEFCWRAELTGDGAEEGKKERTTDAGLKRRGRARREHGHLLERATRSSTCPNARGSAELAKRCTTASPVKQTAELLPTWYCSRLKHPSSSPFFSRFHVET
jgi:hypothetical protein